jgi:sulfur-oxidizing protein SoxX
MDMNKKIAITFLCAALTQFAWAEEKTASGKSLSKNPVSAEAEKVFRDSFRVDSPKYWSQRIEQDETMKLCSQYKDNPPVAVRQKIELAQKVTIRYPVDGKLLGDWKAGEKIAAHGRGGHIGFIQPDKPMTPRGGNCYACHQLEAKEVAYGTIGPSLLHFGKIRGNSDDIVKYAYDKIYNSNVFSACTNMPRFGLHNWLTPEEITHIVAFLMDPESPVNKD